VVNITKMRIINIINNHHPQWTNSFIFIDNKYMNNVTSWIRNLSIEQLATLKITFTTPRGRKYKKTYTEGIDDIGINGYPKVKWRDILPALR